jgi:GAF domain-containing protein
MARLIHDDELNRLVRELISTVPGADLVPSEFSNFQPDKYVASHSMLNIYARTFNAEPAIGVITERAQALTGASGAAIALRSGTEVICRARSGRTAPDLGIRLQTDSGISAECLRTGEVVLCNDAEDDPQVDLASCRRLGVRSILAAPLRQFHRTLGIFEVLSASPNAFRDQHVTTMQMLAGMMVAAISRLSQTANSGQC